MKNNEKRNALLEELHHNVFNYVKGMDEHERKKVGWLCWIDQCLDDIARHDAITALGGLEKLVGDNRPA